MERTHFRELTIRFDSTRGIRQREIATATFPVGSRVLRAQAMLKGFKNLFTDTNREFKEMEVDLDVTAVRDNRVDVAADLVLRDASGNYDDRYHGFVQCVVVAVVEE